MVCEEGPDWVQRWPMKFGNEINPISFVGSWAGNSYWSKDKSTIDCGTPFELLFTTQTSTSQAKSIFAEGDIIAFAKSIWLGWCKCNEDS